MHTGNLSPRSARCDLNRDGLFPESLVQNGKGSMDRENKESMEEIHVRILRVTDDLRVIQRELNCAAMQAPTDPELMEALADPPEMETIQILKPPPAQTRPLLWFTWGV